MCHTAEIDGIAYFGAGTKVFDDKFLGEALKTVDERTLADAGRPRSLGRGDVANANRILNSHHHDKIDSLTRGRSTAFAASHVELYMRPNQGVMPPPEAVGRGTAKLHRYGTRRPRCQRAAGTPTAVFTGEFR